MKTELKGIFLTLLGGTSWGLSGSVGQYLFTVEQMDSRWLVPIRLGSAGILMLLWYAFRHGRQVFSPWRDRTEARELLIYGLLGVTACQFFYFLTIQLSTAAIATILQDLSPVLILLYTCRLARRSPRPMEVFSILLALVGVTLIASHGDLANLMTSSHALIAGVICACAVLVYNVVPVHLMDRYPVFLLQGWAFLMGGALLFFVFHIWTIPYVPGFRGLLGIAFVVLVGNVVAFTAYMNGVKYIGPNKAILYGFSEPICAAVIGTLIFGNPFTRFDMLGFLCVFAMLLLISFNGKK